MVPHEAPHNAVYSITTKHHVTCFDSAIAQRDLDATHQLLHFCDRTLGFDPCLIREAIIQDPKEISPLKEEDVLAMTGKFGFTRSACAFYLYGP